MKILDSTKTLTALASDTSNGLGNIQPLECTVTEELNGIYECEFSLNTNDPFYADLKSSGLFKIPVNEGGDEQIFRVYEWGEEISQVAHVKAQHITYDLGKIPVTPFSATGAVNAKNNMLSHILGTYDFTMTTDISNTTSTFNLTIPRSFRECMGGYEGSLLDVFRCEYQYDNLEVKMLARRGADNGVRIAYGKNLTDFKQEQNLANVYDAVYGYAVVDDVTYEASGIYNKTGASYPKVLNVDFSNKYETGDVPTGAELLAYATAYATNNDIEVPKVSIDIEFVPLWQTAEYKNILPLERVNLGDTVHVYFDKLGVTASSRVIKTVWNALTKKYDEIELGDAKADLNTVINQVVDDGVSNAMDEIDVGWLDQKVETMSNLIANGLGLHISQDSLGRIILHNEETIALSQYQYMITSSGFMLSEDYGATWSSGWDISGNAVLNSLSTITLKALEIYGSFMRFGDVNTNYIDVLPYSNAQDIPQGVTFDGTGTIRMQPQTAFYVNNLDGNGDYYNRLMMSYSGGSSNNYIEFINYDDTHNIIANFFELDAHYVYSGNTYNRMVFHNYNTITGTRYSANMILMEGRENNSNFYIRNRIPKSADVSANYLSLTASTTTDSIGLVNQKPDNTDYGNQLYFASSGTFTNSFIYNRKYDAVEPANTLSMYSMSTYTALNLYNYSFNASSVISNHLELYSNSSGNSVKLENNDDSGSVVNILSMSSDQTMTLWGTADMRIRSAGAIRIYANQDQTTQTGDYQNTGYTGGTQDVYIGGYSLKLQCRTGGRIYLYWGSTRYYLGVSNGVVTATSA